MVGAVEHLDLGLDSDEESDEQQSPHQAEVQENRSVEFVELAEGQTFTDEAALAIVNEVLQQGLIRILEDEFDAVASQGDEVALQGDGAVAPGQDEGVSANRPDLVVGSTIAPVEATAHDGGAAQTDAQPELTSSRPQEAERHEQVTAALEIDAAAKEHDRTAAPEVRETAASHQDVEAAALLDVAAAAPQDVAAAPEQHETAATQQDVAAAAQLDFGAAAQVDVAAAAQQGAVQSPQHVGDAQQEGGDDVTMTWVVESNVPDPSEIINLSDDDYMDHPHSSDDDEKAKPPSDTKLVDDPRNLGKKIKVEKD